ncbi:MAG: DUF6015 family protein [Thermoplasmatota archaeon]
MIYKINHLWGIIMQNEMKNILKDSIKNIMGMSEEDWLNNIVEMIIGLMDKNGRIDDDRLDTDLRGIFYLLERNKILKMDITEKHISDGRIWKNHYWILDRDGIEKADSFDIIDRPEKNIGNELSTFYRNLPDKVWATHCESAEAFC